MKAAVLAAFAAAAMVASAEIKVGIIGLDTSHAITFAKIINVEKTPEVEGMRIVAAYQWGSKDIFSSTNRYPKYIAQIKEMGVKIVPTIDELIERHVFVPLHAVLEVLDQLQGRIHAHIRADQRLLDSIQHIVIHAGTPHNGPGELLEEVLIRLLEPFVE